MLKDVFTFIVKSNLVTMKIYTLPFETRGVNVKQDFLLKQLSLQGTYYFVFETFIVLFCSPT